MQPGGFIEVYKKLKSEGTLMVLDMGWDENMSVEKYSDLLDTADIYTPNRKEALRITGAANENDAADALKNILTELLLRWTKTAVSA